MIPILYESTETVFTNNGLGRLVDAISVTVTEERNSVYECELVYPMDGEKFSEITEGRIIGVTHDEGGDVQPFDIYGHSAPIDGKVTFYAHHISYRQAGIPVKPFTASTCAGAIAGLKTYSYGTNNFNYWTDKNVSASYKLTVPKPLNSLLKGDEDSLLAVFGSGEYKFDKFDVKLYVNRGTDTDVTIRYGKNLVELTDDIDFTDSYNGIVPYWSGTDNDGNESVVTLSEWAVMKSGATYDGRDTVIPHDFSGDFETKPTESALRAKAQNYLANIDPRLPINTLTVNFVQLWQTEEYKNYAPLQNVKLCDTVVVIFEKLGINVRLKVIKTVWNALLDRYDEIQLGDTPQTYAQVITERLADQAALANAQARWARGYATNALNIAANTDQYFWFTSTGGDTGAHITEVPKEDFITDPTNGGGNLLARSNGIAIRDGLMELGVFSQNGMDITTYDTNNNLVNIAHLGYGSGNAESGTAVNPYYTLGHRIAGSTIGNWSTAEGSNITASGYCAHAEGFGTTASGWGAHAEGLGSPIGSQATGFSSHAEGITTAASGSGSHSEGNFTTASGNYSHTQNSNTIAAYDNQTAMGKFNSNANTNALEIGNGTANNARSNAMTVAWDGTVNAGDYQFNGTALRWSTTGTVHDLDYTNADPNHFKRVPTVDNLAWWSGAYYSSNSNLTYSAHGTILGSDITIVNNPIKDYVTETGVESGWTYRKWKSGRAECWYRNYSDTSAANISDGGGYRTAGVTPPDFPTGLFSVTPQVQVTLQSGGLIMTPVCLTDPSPTSAGKWAGYRISSSSNTTTDKGFNFYASNYH